MTATTTMTVSATSDNSYATQPKVPVVVVTPPPAVKTEFFFPSSPPPVFLGITSSKSDSSNNNLGMTTEPHEIISDFLPSSSSKLPSATQHEQASTVVTETWKNLMIHLDDIDDWKTLLNWSEPKKHNLTSEQIMNVQLEDFLLTDDKNEKDDANEPSAASSIHHGARNKRNDGKNRNSEKFWWPNTKGWLSAGSLLIWVALVIWVSSDSE